MASSPSVSSRRRWGGRRFSAISAGESSYIFMAYPAREIWLVKLVRKKAPKLWLRSLCWLSTAMLPFSVLTPARASAGGC